MGRILVVGATGRVGRHVASQLAATGTNVRALVRNPDTAHLPAEVEVAKGDLSVPESLEQPLDDVETVFLVWTAPSEFVVPALELIANKARRIVFLSAPLKTPHPFFQQPNPARELAEKVVELTGSASKIEYRPLPQDDPQQRQPDIAKAKAVLGWTPTIHLEEGLRRTIAYFDGLLKSGEA